MYFCHLWGETPKCFNMRSGIMCSTTNNLNSRLCRLLRQAGKLPWDQNGARRAELTAVPDPRHLRSDTAAPTGSPCIPEQTNSFLGLKWKPALHEAIWDSYLRRCQSPLGWGTQGGGLGHFSTVFRYWELLWWLLWSERSEAPNKTRALLPWYRGHVRLTDRGFPGAVCNGQTQEHPARTFTWHLDQKVTMREVEHRISTCALTSLMLLYHPGYTEDTFLWVQGIIQIMQWIEILKC